MIDITGKKPVVRIAIAEGTIILKEDTVKKIKSKTTLKKGDVLENAKYAAFHGMKMTSQLVFLSHPIPIHGAKVDFTFGTNSITVTVEARTVDRTGVELEAMMGVLNALMAIFDMTKPEEKDEEGQYPVARIKNVRVVKKIKQSLEEFHK